MSNPNWQELKRIFNEALLQPPHVRDAFVERVCKDEALRVEVLSLLSFHEEDSDFLEMPVDSEALQIVEAEDKQRLLGQSIGPYQLERELGRGGMGLVYLAHRVDGQFDHEVAIKLGKQDEFNLEIRERLQHERQVLASLRHPNIARLLDGGVTEDGRPYFAMEYVEGGIPIDAFCSKHQKSIEERLELFRETCDAVAYAHRQLVVHRDLKPSNILVTPSGTLKLLDFGVAKLLDEEQQANMPITRTGLRILTPEYASPEHVRGEAISTASDVYSLGVVLYELMAGRRPYDVKNLAPTQIERVICEEDPVKPSTAIITHQPASSSSDTVPLSFYKQMRGDLDNIIMKALRKEPALRYGSVEQLNEDIYRYLNQLPISARPATVRYRISKFVRRHRMGVVAMLITLMTLVGGIISTTYQASVALDAREQAERRTEEVRAMANTLLFDIHDAIRDLPGATPARRLLVKNAEQYLDLLSKDLPEDPLIHLELAEAFHRVGEIQGDPHFPNLGDLGGASDYYQKAFELRSALWQADTTDTTAAIALAEAMARLAVVTSWGESNEEAMKLSTKAIEILVPINAQRQDVDILHDIGRIRSELGWWYVFAGQMDEAKATLVVARGELESVGPFKAGQIDFEIDLWRVYNYQADAYRWGDDPALALDILSNLACPRLEGMNEKRSFNPRLQSALRACLNKIGDLNRNAGFFDLAIKNYEAALSIAELLIRSDSTNTLGYGGAASILEALGDISKEKGEKQPAIKYFSEAYKLKRYLYDLDPTNGETGNALGNTLRSLCNFYVEFDAPERALAYCQDSVDIFEDAIAGAPMNGIWRSNLVESYLALAHAQQLNARFQPEYGLQHTAYGEALKAYDEGIFLIRQLEAEGTSFDWPPLLDSLEAIREGVAELYQGRGGD